jgi:hypothetical protein
MWRNQTEKLQDRFIFIAPQHFIPQSLLQKIADSPGLLPAFDRKELI